MILLGNLCKVICRQTDETDGPDDDSIATYLYNSKRT